MALKNAVVHELFRFSRAYLPGRLYRMRDRLFRLLRIRIRTAVAIDGVYINIDTNNYHERGVFCFGTYEAGTRNFIASYVANLSGGVVIDVGANIGLHTLVMAASRRRAEVRVLAFDANPDMVARLRGNLALNGLNDVEVFPIGLDAQSRVLELGLPYLEGQETYTNPGIASMTDMRRAVRTIAVACRPLDEVLAEAGCRHADVKLIKMDVEGKELDVLRGAARVLRDSRAAVIVEYNAPIFEELSALLAEFGYRRSGSLVRYGLEKDTLEENVLFLKVDQSA